MAKQRRPTAQGQNTLRIIAGQWRGRRLNFPAIEGLRPTSDRLRETLFNWLQIKVPGARCLDLFCGSGALGLEALSRGAAHVTLVDRSAPVIQQVRDNLSLLKAENAELQQRTASAWLAQAVPTTAPFDLVFLDPPFRQGLLADCCTQLEQGGLLSENAWIYLEAEKDLSPLPIPANWHIHRQLNAGQVGCYLCIREAPTCTEDNAPTP